MSRAWLGALALIVFIVTLAMWPHGPEAGDDSLWDASNTSYSAGPRGTLALYLLMGELGLQAERFSAPSYKHLPAQATLWLFGSTPLTRRERNEALNFVHGGGTLVAMPTVLAPLTQDAGLGEATTLDANVRSASFGAKINPAYDAFSLDLMTAPDEVFAEGSDGAPIVAAWRVGTGRLVAFGIPDIVANGEIGKGDAGLFLARLALRLGPRHIFDETRQGFGASSLWELLQRVPYRAFLIQMAVLLAVSLCVLVPRRWPVRTRSSAKRRRVADHVEAVARLWERSGSPELPLHALMAALDAAARSRLLLASTDKRRFVDWVGVRRPELQARAQSLWEQAEHLASTPSRRAEETVRKVAAGLIQIERETQLWSKTPLAKQ